MCTDADSVRMKSCRENNRSRTSIYTSITLEEGQERCETHRCIQVIPALISADPRTPCSAGWLEGLREISRYILFLHSGSFVVSSAVFRSWEPFQGSRKRKTLKCETENCMTVTTFSNRTLEKSCVMRKLVVWFTHRVIFGRLVKEDELGRVGRRGWGVGTYGVEEKCIERCGGKTRWKETTWKTEAWIEG